VRRVSTSASGPQAAARWTASSIAGLVVLAACSVSTGSTNPETGSTNPETGSINPTGRDVDDPSLDAGLSEPVEDSVYPEVGDPGVDALHYGLDLAWDPETTTLTGLATVVLRATADAERFQLDLSPALTVEEVRVDGEAVEHDHAGKDLRVLSPVRADERYALVVEYSGVPEPVQAPTTRSDFSTTGLTTTPDGEAWTMQEPYGAFTWYPVNDQPADKALYDFALSTSAPFVGIANGELLAEEATGGVTTTRWQLDAPAASYLTTLAFGDYQRTTNTSSSGVAIDYWVPRDSAALAPRLEEAAAGLDWLEQRLGAYPFDSLGFVLVDSRSGMETQTMITLGMTDYTTSGPVIVHELAHHWYGNQVTPDDWRDVWMNEGMAMYLQAGWQADQSGRDVAEIMDEWALFEPGMRAESGPPADYDPAEFGEGNIYYSPALMWHELRERVGDEVFWRIVRDWPASQAQSAGGDGSADREEYLAWIEEETGQELTSFFDAWLLGETTPPRT
jgi:aminopeptidase N